MPRKYISQTIKKTVASNQQWCCNICKNILEETFETDHIIPIMNGGTNEQSNLQSLCPNCHRKKSLHEKCVKPSVKKTNSKNQADVKTKKQTDVKTKIQIDSDIIYESMFGETREMTRKNVFNNNRLDPPFRPNNLNINQIRF